MTINSAYVRIGGRDFPIEAGKIAWTLNAVTDVEFVLPRRYVSPQNLLFQDYVIYRRGEPAISGIILDEPELVDSETSAMMLKVKAADELGRLTCFRADTDAHFQDETVVAIINQLLNVTGGQWILSNVTTMPDPLIKTTIDLRGKETLWAQIVEAVTATPDVNVRYAGFNALLGVHQIEVGQFRQKTQRFAEGDNLTKLRLRKSTERRYNMIEAYGDFSTGQVLHLGHALSNPDTLSHPDYAQFPIVLDNGQYVVINLDMPAGCQAVRRFKVHKTRNDRRPTDEEVQQGSYALWLKAVRFLKTNIDTTSFTGAAMVTDIPRIADDAFIRGRVEEPVYDPIQHKIVRYEPTYEVDTWLQMVRLTLKFNDGMKIPSQQEFSPSYRDEIEFEVNDKGEAEELDPTIYLVKKLEQTDLKDNLNQAVNLETDVVSLNYGGPDASDCTAFGGAGKIYEIYPSVTPPVTPPKVSATYFVSPGNARVNVISIPDVLGDPFIACVQTGGGTWPPSSPGITLTVQFTYVTTN